MVGWGGRTFDWANHEKPWNKDPLYNIFGKPKSFFFALPHPSILWDPEVWIRTCVIVFMCDTFRWFWICFELLKVSFCTYMTIYLITCYKYRLDYQLLSFCWLIDIFLHMYYYVYTEVVCFIFVLTRHIDGSNLTPALLQADRMPCGWHSWLGAVRGFWHPLVAGGKTDQYFVLRFTGLTYHRFWWHILEMLKFWDGSAKIDHSAIFVSVFLVDIHIRRCELGNSYSSSHRPEIAEPWDYVTDPEANGREDGQNYKENMAWYMMLWYVMYMCIYIYIYTQYVIYILCVISVIFAFMLLTIKREAS